jgi:pimeloyl-ACP methyl ester carboxylesterase
MPLPLIIRCALVVAASAVYSNHRSRKSEEDRPPTGRFVEVDGVRLHYIEKGQGRPVVMLHGNSSMAFDFEVSGLVDIAAAHYRVIVFDRPGYGYSERPRDRTWTACEQARLFSKAFKAVGAERPLVLGHSWGALVAIALALDFPEAIAALVLEGGYFYPVAPIPVPRSIPVIGDLMRYSVSPLLLRALWPLIVWRVFAPAAVPACFKNFPIWLALRPLPLEASQEELALTNRDTRTLSKRYRELRLPAVIIAGRDDQLVNTEAHSVRLHIDVPHTDLHILKGHGHMVHYTEPMAVLEALHSLAAKVDAPRTGSASARE